MLMNILKKMKCNQNRDEHFEKKTDVIRMLMNILKKNKNVIIMLMKTLKTT